jgi:hypothetical protein
MSRATVLGIVLFFSFCAFAKSSGSHSGSHSSHSSRSHSSKSHRAKSSSAHSSYSHAYRKGYVAPGYTLHSSVQRDSHGRIKRSSAAKNAFKRQHPCPSTGRSSGNCPGYVVDHVNPLECGGADTPPNMQWQTTAAATAKDRTERYCR